MTVVYLFADFIFFSNLFDGARAGAEKMSQTVFEPVTNKKATVWIYSVTVCPSCFPALEIWTENTAHSKKKKCRGFNIEKKNQINKLFSSTFPQTTCMVAEAQHLGDVERKSFNWVSLYINKIKNVSARNCWN